MESLNTSELGKRSAYITQYDASLLFPISREIKRQEIGITGTLPFHGVDIWNAYELSWLNPKGKPQVAVATMLIPCESPNIIESKSLKLYFNSFNQTRFDHTQQVIDIIGKDLSAAAGMLVQVQLQAVAEFDEPIAAQLAGENIDGLDVEITTYQTDSSLLKAGGEICTEVLSSDLLKSNCLVTEQPDWGSVMIHYHGKQMDREALLKYLISFREHNEFHEQCVERIFNDILTHCAPEKLTVYARYTRRGGLDINPFRSNFEANPVNLRLCRQ